MLDMYKERTLTYFMDRFPAVANMILDSDYISSCNFSMNFFPVVLNADDELGMATRIPITSYFCVKNTKQGGVQFDTSIFYDTYKDAINERPLSRKTKGIEDLSTYITKYLQKYNVHADVILRIFMARDRDTGFGYKSFWVTMLAYWMLVTTGQITDFALWNPKHKDALLTLVKKIYTLVGDSTFKRGTFLGPLWYEHAHPVYYTNKDIVNLYNYTSDIMPVDIVILNFGSGYERDTSVKAIDEFHRTRKNYAEAVHGVYHNHYLNNFAYCLKAEFMIAYDKLAQNPNNDVYVHRLMTTIEHVNSFARIVEGPNDMIDVITRLWKDNKSFENEQIGILPVTSNQYADNIMLIANKNRSRKTLDTIIDKIHALNSCAIEYVSRVDKDYKTGIQIEHYPTHDIYLPGYEQYDCAVKTADGGVEYKKYGDIACEYTDCLVIDSIANKIYKNGETIDSTMLPSQTYTIALLKMLFETPNEWLSNKLLPISAYSKSMNQFSGKILSPLKKITTELLGTPIQIHITGSLYDFEVKMSSSDDRFVFVAKK